MEAPHTARARELLFDAAARLRERRFEYDALLVYEVGKSWPEADGDIAEAIDFLEFYAREALRYAEPQPIVPIEGERNEMVYIPLGVGAVIPPWNFAGAIMMGMTSAAIVTGNTVVLKPSSDSAVIAAWFVDLLHEIGLPKGVVNFIPGSGSVIGDLDRRPSADSLHLVHRFERSRSAHQRACREDRTGTEVDQARRRRDGRQRFDRRRRRCRHRCGRRRRRGLRVRLPRPEVFGVFARDRRCAASTTSSSSKLKDRVAKMNVGDPEQQATYMGPVVNESAMKSISDYIEVGKKEGRLIAGGNRVGSEGFFLEPTVIADVDPKARIAQEEIFGPVLAVIKAKDFDDAMEIANNTEFGLTGSLYTSDEAKIERAREDFFVGNLYFNRKSTGAYVGVHPFGGFNMSGTDSKAGGRDYLLLFMQAKTMSRKVCRAQPVDDRFVRAVPAIGGEVTRVFGVRCRIHGRNGTPA